MALNTQYSIAPLIILTVGLIRGCIYGRTARQDCSYAHAAEYPPNPRRPAEIAWPCSAATRSGRLGKLHLAQRRAAVPYRVQQLALPRGPRGTACALRASAASRPPAQAGPAAPNRSQELVAPTAALAPHILHSGVRGNRARRDGWPPSRPHSQAGPAAPDCSKELVAPADPFAALATHIGYSGG